MPPRRGCDAGVQSPLAEVPSPKSIDQLTMSLSGSLLLVPRYVNVRLVSQATKLSQKPQSMRSSGVTPRCVQVFRSPSTWQAT